MGVCLLSLVVDYLQYGAILAAASGTQFIEKTWPRMTQSLQETTGLPVRASLLQLSDLIFVQSERIQQAILRAHDSMSGPGPSKPFAPTFEQLRITDSVTDLEISKKLRPTVRDSVKQRMHPNADQLPDKLSKKAELEVKAILGNPRFVSKVGREQVSHNDIQRLKPSQWLNDEIINFYGQLILDRSMNQEAQKENIDISKTALKSNKCVPLRVHYFNTFFYPKLMQGYAKSNLKKWTKRVSLVPIRFPDSHVLFRWTSFRKMPYSFQSITVTCIGVPPSSISAKSVLSRMTAWMLKTVESRTSLDIFANIFKKNIARRKDTTLTLLIGRTLGEW